MRKWRIIAIVIISVIVVSLMIGSILYLKFKKPVIKAAKVEAGNIKEKLNVSSNVVLGKKFNITTGSGGRKIEKIYVEEGDYVEEGEVVAILTAKDLEAQIKQANAAVKAAEANLDQLLVTKPTDAQLRAAQAQVKQSQAAYDMVKNTKATDDQIKAAKAQVDQAQAAYDMVKNTKATDEQIRVARAGVDQAQATLDAAEINLEMVKSNPLSTKYQISLAETQVAQAQAALDAAQANYDMVKNTKASDEQVRQAEAALNAAQANYDIVKNTKSSDDQIRQAEAAYEAAQANYDIVAEKKATNEQIRAAQAQVESASAARELVETQYEQTRLKAPITGVVVQLNFKESDILPMEMGMPLLGAGTSTSSGGSSSSLGQVAQLNKVEVEASLDELDTPKVKIGQKVEVVVDAFPFTTLLGEVQYLGFTVVQTQQTQEKATGYKLRVLLTDTKGLGLRENMGCKLNIIVGESGNVLKISRDALVTSAEKYYVFLLDKKTMKVSKRLVQTGLLSEDEAEIISGINQGDMVILKPPAELKEGAVVKVK